MCGSVAWATGTGAKAVVQRSGMLEGGETCQISNKEKKRGPAPAGVPHSSRGGVFSPGLHPLLGCGPKRLNTDYAIFAKKMSLSFTQTDPTLPILTGGGETTQSPSRPSASVEGLAASSDS